MSLPCYYALGGINFKNGFATSCPQQSDQLTILDNEHLPSKFFNNENFKKHRKDLMNGIWPKGCDMCEFVERDNSGTSMRQEETADLTYYNKDGSVDFAGLKTAEIRFSNSCNMACLHCSMVFSSGWMSKLKHYQSDSEDKEHELIQLTGAMHRKSPDDDLTMSISKDHALEIVEDLNKNFPNLERVDFAGGEVLYQKQFLPTLEKLTEHPNVKNMKIMFHTNFNADFDANKLGKLLENFNSVQIMISIDGGPKIYPYFRQGNWNKLKNNIEKYRQVNKTSDIVLVCTTGVYQLMEFTDIIDGFLKLDSDGIDTSIVYTPDYLNPSIMMIEHKDFVLDEIEKSYKIVENIESQRKANIAASSKLHSYIGNYYNSHEWKDLNSAHYAIDKVKQYVLNHQAAEQHWKAFEVYVRKSDKIWKQDFNNYISTFKFVNNKVLKNV